jgi:hypothetical protein
MRGFGVMRRPLCRFICVTGGKNRGDGVAPASTSSSRRTFMLSLPVTHALLVLTSVLLTLALASMSPVNVMLAVAAHFIAGQMVGQAMVAEPVRS